MNRQNEWLNSSKLRIKRERRPGKSPGRRSLMRIRGSYFSRKNMVIGTPEKSKFSRSRFSR